MREKIFCNPLPLPDLGLGVCCRMADADPSMFNGKVRDFREVSDPEMLYDNGVWYMYPSVSQAFVSKDFVNWEYKKIDIECDLGYAPSVIKFRNKYLLTSSVLFREKKTKIFEAPTPLGPFNLIGEMLDMHGNELLPEYLDPSLFVDDDGKLYVYWGCSPYDIGIFGVELDPEHPNCAVCEPVKLIEYKRENTWEHYGEYNEHPDFGWDEGVAMFKHNNIYYLQYAGCGTVFRNYTIGCYMSSESPLGPFKAPTAPMVQCNHGIVNGTGHGGWVKGPEGSVWQFYTCRIGRVHRYERRVGMDKVEFAPDGTPHVKVTSTPQFIIGGDAGLLPLSFSKKCKASSFEDNAFPFLAVDENTHTCWFPEAEDKTPFLEVDLAEEFSVSAARMIWAEKNLNVKNNIFPEAIQYRIEFFDRNGKQLDFAVDRSDNRRDLNVDFVTFAPVKAQKVRISILKNAASRIHAGLIDFTVFGTQEK